MCRSRAAMTLARDRDITAAIYRSADLPFFEEELSMRDSNRTPASVPPSHDENLAGDCGPMAQQNMRGAHGHDMHPQKLVRLVGCHDISARKPDDPEHSQ